MPISPSGETTTMARKMKPTTVVNVPPRKGTGTRKSRNSPSRTLFSMSDERERPHEGAFDSRETADDSHHEQRDRRVEPEVGGRDLAVPPGREHARDSREQTGEGEREHAMERHRVAERGHAHGLVPDTLEREAERRAGDETDQDVADERAAEGDVVEAIAVL